MKRDLRLDEYSTREIEPLPPHIELTHGPDGTLRKLFAEMSPQGQQAALAYLEVQARKGRK